MRSTIWRPSREAALATYYLSAAGSDDASGRSPARAWATLERLHKTRFCAGDVILLRRGDRFSGRLSLERIESHFLGAPPIRVGAFGRGRSPIVDGYRVVETQSWERIDANVWFLAYSLTAKEWSHRHRNIGFLNVGGEIWGARVFSLSDLREERQFLCADDGLYVRAAFDLTELPVKIAYHSVGCTTRSGFSYRDICFVGHGAHGLQCPDQVADVKFSRCIVREFGGAVLRGRLRFGNGFEAWVGSRNIKVTNCAFVNGYDAGVTIQGTAATKSAVAFDAVTIEKSVVAACQQAFEAWAEVRNKGGVSDGFGFVGCAFSDNVCIDIGRGWSSDLNPSKKSQGAILFYNLMVDNFELSIEGNVLFNCRGPFLVRPAGRGPLVSNLIIRDNIIYVDTESVVEILSTDVSLASRQHPSAFRLIHVDNSDGDVFAMLAAKAWSNSVSALGGTLASLALSGDASF